MRRKSNKLSKWQPLILAASIGLGMFLGQYLTRISNSRRHLAISGGNKINTVLNIINRNYVDSVDINKLIEITIPTLFKELDPHSVYLSAEQNKKDENLEGTFDGIGITFNMLSDTITVINVSSGGPSEKVGIKPGDRIVKIDTIDYLKEKINQEKIKKLLRGAQDTQVRLLVKPYKQDTIKEVTITRGIVPVKTINAAYALTPEIGYIKINSFGRPTYNEFLIAIAKLKNEGCTSLIIDLRGNGGGYMEAAIDMINEFLYENEMIVYAQGQFFPKRISLANGKGSCKDTPIIVLTDELSGSSSEIFAGAIQDNDRGLIVGRRTYGKGLIQAPFELADGSRITLTIARYYTPSGRSIQKEYKLGQNEEYERDLYNRFMKGEFYNQDSIHITDSVKFFTKHNRIVYGGGGIMPDVFVPQDTTGYTSYFASVVNSGLLHHYAFNYADKYRYTLEELGDYATIHNYLKTQPILWDFIDFAAKKGIRKRLNLIYISAEALQQLLYSNIIYYISGDEGSVATSNVYDPAIKKAVELFEAGEANPNQVKNHHFSYEQWTENKQMNRILQVPGARKIEKTEEKNEEENKKEQQNNSIEESLQK